MDHNQLLGLSKVFNANSASSDAVVVCPDGETFHFGDMHAHNPLMLYIKNMQMVRMFDQQSYHGLESSYVKGFWDCNNIPQLLAMSHRTDQKIPARLLTKYHHSPSHPRVLRQYAQDAYRMKDLALEFYAAWYDPGLVGGIATFSQHKRDPLYVSQQRSLQRILKILQHHHAVSVLDTNGMWGAFAEKACLHHDVTLVTSTRTQAEFCQNRMRSIPFPVNYQIKTRKPDSSSYTPFDAVVSMLPTIACQRDWHEHLSFCASHLKCGGVAVIQSVYDTTCSPAFVAGQLERHQFRLLEQDHMNRDAAKTYRYWVNNFSTNQQQIEQLGFSKPYLRLWQYYLSQMAYYFESGHLQARQFTVEKVTN